MHITISSVEPYEAILDLEDSQEGDVDVAQQDRSETVDIEDERAINRLIGLEKADTSLVTVDLSEREAMYMILASPTCGPSA